MQPVFQDPNTTLNPTLLIFDIIAEGIEIHKLARSPAEMRQQVHAALEQVGLPPSTLDYRPNSLSAGERQRVSIARALAVKPAFLVCDEPMSALDVSVQAQLARLLLRVQQRTGIAYLFISHDVRMVLQLSHRVAVMYFGKIVETGPTAALGQRRLHPYTRALFEAAPSFDPDRKRLRILLQGEPPSAAHPPQGCAFHPRCPRAEPGVCDTEPPHLTPVTGEHHVACHHPHL
jgi:oligopeptide transport system ATP-binding protein